MKTVAQNITNEIEYLSALARMLERDRQAQAATLETINALRQLLQVIDRQANGSAELISIAA